MLGFAERGKPGYLVKNLLEQSREPTNSTLTLTQATLVAGECSQHYASPALQSKIMVFKHWKLLPNCYGPILSEQQEQKSR